MCSAVVYKFLHLSRVTCMAILKSSYFVKAKFYYAFSEASQALLFYVIRSTANLYSTWKNTYLLYIKS